MMKEFTEKGGKVIWSGPPPVLTLEGEPALDTWTALFGVDYKPEVAEGVIAPSKLVTFDGPLKSVAPQVVPTDFLVDRVYPVTPKEGTAVAGTMKSWTLATHRTLPGGGSATFLGYRPRDDQSKSLGYETRNWFEVLNAVGAYAPTGRIAGMNDNTDYVSRTTDYLTCRFPNGAVAIARHFRDMDEDWPGGFSRKPGEDKAWADKHPMPSEALDLKEFRVNGHTVSYVGTQTVSFRVNAKGDLLAFSGRGCKSITVDGRKFDLSDQDLGQLCWAPTPKERRVEKGAVLQMMVAGAGAVRIPAAEIPEGLTLVAEGATPGSRGVAIPSHRENGALVFTITPEISGRWIYGVPGGAET
jgi:hypothetical protein